MNERSTTRRQRRWPLLGLVPVLLGPLLLVHLLAPGRASAEPDPLGDYRPPSPEVSTAILPAKYVPRMPIVDFLERSYIFYSLPPPDPNPSGHFFWLAFEAQPVIHLSFYNSIADRARQRSTDLALAFSGTFLARIRMLSTDSAAIRTPSYEPGFNLQLVWFDFNEPAQEGYRDLGARLNEIQLRLRHHSNGQEYCQFAEGVEDASRPPCSDAYSGYPDVTRLNRRNGSFSTNYLSLGAHRRWITEVDRSGYAARSHSLGGTFEVHPRFLGFLPGSIERDTYDQYRPWRFRLEADLSWLVRSPEGIRSPGQLRLNATAEVMLDNDLKDSARYRLAVEGSRTFLDTGGIGYFLRLYSGQDYYNVLYHDNIDFQVHVGFIVDLSPPLFFGNLPAGAAAANE